MLVLCCLLFALTAQAATKAELKAKALAVLKTNHEQIMPKLADAYFFAAHLANDKSVWASGANPFNELCPGIFEMRTGINQVRDGWAKWASQNKLESEYQSLVEALAKQDCLYASGYALWSRLDAFCANAKRGKQDALDALNGFLTKKFGGYWTQAKAGRAQCEKIIQGF